MSAAWTDASAIRLVSTEVSETPEWIAEQIGALLTCIGEATGISSWTVPEGPAWPDDEAARAEIVRAAPSTGSTGSPDATQGYEPTVSGTDGSLVLQVMVSAGDSLVGHRVPLHTVVVRVLTESARWTPEAAEAVVRGAAGTFGARMVSATSRAATRLSRSGGWAIPPAYRLWLHREVGEVSAVPDGMLAEPHGDGVLVRTDDAWSAEELVAAHANLVERNGLGEIPR